VPAARVLALPSPEAREPGPLYAFPLYGLLAVGIAAVALGLAGAAVEELVALAATKTPSGSRRLLRERSRVQADVAAAEGRLGSSRAYLHDRVGRAFDRASHGGVLSLEDRAGLRLAATHATRASVEAVDLLYEAAGGSAVYARSPLQRIFRDAHVVTQHVMVAPATLELVGRIRLGLAADASML
jgi:indole-3-acetate monooxygenase